MPLTHTMSRRNLIHRTRGVAAFIYKGAREQTDRTIKLYTCQSGELVVDSEGSPKPNYKGRSTPLAVATFATLREMSTKDYGATPVSWGDYSYYAQFWPNNMTPWQEEI